MQKNYDKELMLNSEQFLLKARSQDFNKQHEEAALKNTLNQAPLAAVNREFQRITKVKASSEDVEDNENLKLLHLCLKSYINGKNNDKNQLYPPTLNHNNIDAKKVIVRHFNARGIGNNNTAFVPGNFFYKRNAVDKTKEKQR